MSGSGASFFCVRGRYCLRRTGDGIVPVVLDGGERVGVGDAGEEVLALLGDALLPSDLPHCLEPCAPVLRARLESDPLVLDLLDCGDALRVYRLASPRPEKMSPPAREMLRGAVERCLRGYAGSTKRPM